jgi:hypothetical protein
MNHYDFFESKWISNLAVVPLLRLSALRFAPAFFALRALLFSVTFVRETIKSLPMLNKINKLKTFIPWVFKALLNAYLSGKCLLPVISVAVKDILPRGLKFFTLAPIFILWAGLLFAGVTPPEEISLGPGEYYELTLPHMQSFSVGNKDVLKVKELKKKKTLLVKAHRQGHSEILVWTKSGEKKRWHFFVLSKIKKLQQVEIQNSLQIEGLAMKRVGKILVPQGEIKTRSGLHLVSQLLQSEDVDTSELDLAPQLKKEWVTEIYRFFFDQHLDSISCHFQKLFLLCFVSDQKKFLDSPLLKEQKKKWPLTFLQSEHRPSADRNYKIKMRLFAFERSDGHEINLGTNILQSLVKDVLERGPLALVEGNQIKLQSHNLIMTTLAMPEGLAILDEEVIFAVGSDIPFQSLNTRDSIQSTQWKFVGLKTLFKIHQKADYFMLDYKTEYSRPTGAETTDSVATTNETGKAYLKLNTPQYLFNLDLQIEQKLQAGIPLLRHIPLLGHLFQSHQKGKVYKKVLGVVELQEQSLF